MVAPTGAAAVPQKTDKSSAMSGGWVRNVELSQDGAQAIAEMQESGEARWEAGWADAAGWILRRWKRCAP
jgi:hypothetical protein